MTGSPRIAIVGMACRYPDADGPGELWQSVLGRRRGFRLLPEQRLAADYRGDGPDTTYVKYAGLLRDWRFDREAFGVPGSLYRAADEAHWLALRVAADALADAGFPDADGLDRDRAGVVLGNSLTGEFSRASQLRLRWPFIRRAAEHALADAGLTDEQTAKALALMEHSVKDPFATPGDESLAGALANTIAGRVCNHFDLHGTGYTVDGACSSSLLSVMTACRALVSGELDFVLAGGVDLSLDPFELVGFARMGALAADEMRIYDAEPTGFLPGEGCGMVALMRAADAQRAGLRTYATLIGWGTSSDGAGGLTRPTESGQVLAASRAYAMAGITPQTVELIEGHGTGTAVGDAIELAALNRLRGGAPAPAALGSVKANIGHTKAAAGAAGLIKATLALHHRILPPTTGCREPHELLRRPGVPLRLLAEPEPWQTATARAAVSAMGFGGINTHVLLEDTRSQPVRSLPAAALSWSRPLPEREIVLLTAASANELAERLDLLSRQAERLSIAEMHDLAASEYDRRRHGSAVRCALVAGTPERLASLGRAARARIPAWHGGLLVDESGYVLGSGRPGRIGLLFPGQAAPVRAQLPEWATSLDVPPVPHGLRIVDGELDTAVAQPAIVRQSLAGLAWLAALGCEPVGAVGHSLGEIAALVWAGALSPAEGLRLSRIRGGLMSKHGRPGTAMASVAAGADRVGELIAGTGVTISGLNAPAQTSVAGGEPEIREVVARAHRAGLAATVLPVSHGFHSEAMRPVAVPLREALKDVVVESPCRTVFSTVTGDVIDRDVPGLLAEQLTSPVRFTEALAGLAARCDLLVEAGPGRTLADLAHACGTGVPAVALDRGAHALATAAIAALGAGDLRPWFEDRAYRPISLDTPITLLSNPCEVSASTTPALPARDAPVEDAQGSDSPTLRALREHLSETLELPVRAIKPGATLLGDLHLNSLQIIQAALAVATALGLAQPDPPADVTAATVADLAETLARQPVRHPDSDTRVPGVHEWVRPFEHHWVTAEPGRGPVDVRWSVHAPEQHWLRRLATVVDAAPRGLAVWLDDSADIAAVIRRIAEYQPEVLAIVHDGHPAAAALARSAAVELAGCATTVIHLPPRTSTVDFGLLGRGGYLELRVTPESRVQRIATRPRPFGGERGRIPLGAGDVCLVTGGAAGITAYCAAALAARTGCVPVLLGRSAPPTLGEGAHYVQCDVTDPVQVRSAVAACEAFGPIRGLLHGAGVNEPRPMAAVSGTSLSATVRPKVDGLRHLLDEIGTDLRVLVGFGSIIGRRGLPGQSEYCVANDWMRHEFESWAARTPGCRTRLLEWSLWRDIGMGPRLGVVETLRAQGIVPIEPAMGAEAMLDVLADDSAPVTVLLTGRFPASPTLTVEGPRAVPRRFAENVLVRVPGVEAVTESSLSLGDDPYLDDHRIDGVPVLPAVAGLEAMAQAVAAATGDRDHWSFTGVEFRAPIMVHERDARALRVAALATGPDETAVVLRDGDDRFVATARPAPAPTAHAQADIPELVPVSYDLPLFFHKGQFRRLAGYEFLSAFRVRAWLRADGDARWFSDFHSGDLLLGDLGSHDAVLHSLLACVPHRRALPVGADRVTVWRKPEGLLRVTAWERSHTADQYVFDVSVTTTGGVPVVGWDGLRLKAVGAVDWHQPMPVELVGPLMSRRLIECGLADDLELVTMAEEAPPGVIYATPGEGSPDPTASEIADKAGEPLEVAAARVEAARRLLEVDTGRSPINGQAINSWTINMVSEDRLVVLQCGRAQVATVIVRTTTTDQLVAGVVI